MKILFANRLFENISGGIERISIAIMNELARRGHEIDLLSWDQPQAKTYFALDKRIVWHRLGIGDAHYKASILIRLRRQIKIRKILIERKPDIIVAFQHGPFLTMATAMMGLNIPILAAERSTPARFYQVRGKRWNRLLFQSFRLADCIAVQSPDFVKGYPIYLRDRIVCIPNPVQPTDNVAQPKGLDNQRKILLCVGRLSYPKNQSALIEAFALLADSFLDWDLWFVGSGENESDLKAQVRARMLDTRVLFYPTSKDINSFYMKCHLFCLPSFWEGFPNVVAEAMAHGLPVVGYASCEGLRQLIESGKNGLLAEGLSNPKSLASALAVLMSDPLLRCKMGNNAISSMTKYKPNLVFDQWEQTLKKVVTNS